MKELDSDYRTGRKRCAYYNISTKVKHATPRAPLLVNFSTMSPVVLALMKVSVCWAKILKKFLLSLVTYSLC